MVGTAENTKYHGEAHTPRRAILLGIDAIVDDRGGDGELDVVVGVTKIV